MRLTLRTLLAYLDSVLDPADAEQLGAKIKESEFATGLVQRIQSIVTKPRMGAAKVDAKGLTADANNVAEYLDSSLPPDRVGDFERVCLESDISLAEAAACHQILTLVLGKPADVPVGLRERVYALNLEPTVAVAALGASAAAASGTALPKPAASPPPPPPSKAPAAAQVGVATTPREVPDYLRSGRRTALWPYATALAVAFLLVAGGLRAMGPFDSNHPLLRMVGAAPAVVAQNPNQNGTVTPPSGVTPPVVAPPPPSGNPPPPADESGTTASVPPTASTDLPSDELPATVPDEPAPPMPDASLPTEIPPAVEEGPPSTPPDESAASTPSPMPPSGVELPPVPGDEEAVDPMPPTGSGDPTSPAAPVSTDIGRYVTDEQLLGRFDAANSVWARMPSRGLLVANERLVSFPTYRPQLALASGAQITLVGDAAIVLGAPENGHSVVLVDYGRLLIETIGAAGTELNLNLTGMKGSVVLSDADTALAVEVRHFLPPGADPEAATDPVIPVVELFATRGRVTWKEEGAAPVEISANHSRIFAGEAQPVTSGPFRAPEWVDPRNQSSLDRDTSKSLAELVNFQKPLNVSLQELLQDRRVDVRALAARCLGSLDNFEPLIKELSDARQYSFWMAELDSLTSALARGPETAAAVRTTIEKLRPGHSKAIYRLLWGYSPEQLASGEAEQLVKYLDSPEIEVRVLTFDNLRKITGLLMLYRPERKIDQNKLAVQKWKEKLKDGTIAYKLSPSPLPIRVPLDQPPGAK